MYLELTFDYVIGVPDEVFVSIVVAGEEVEEYRIALVLHHAQCCGEYCIYLLLIRFRGALCKLIHSQLYL